ncbi:MAG: glycosyltransferase family 2 protein [Calothrix sp. C42_A2020_038]|nr:glycosyltransferase family 2 protein [Calothrix sp. C42_A2020_038]
MSVDFTVAIPTYNGACRLPKVLEKLQMQVGIEHLSWEIIVVDNNSTDETAKLVEECQANWRHPAKLRYCVEFEQGAAFARQRAIMEAEGEIVGFLDDDNLPYPTWILEAYKFIQEYPQVGAIASQIHGDFEVKPPENLKPLLFYLAITERGSEPHMFEPRYNGFPPSAGLVVRRNAWKDNVPAKLFLVGRVGNSMIGSEDAEALFYVHKAGWEIWYNPAMEVDHVIPAWRLERDYLVSLMRGVGLARFRLRMLRLKAWQRPFAFFVYVLNDFRKLLVYFIRNYQVIESDVLVACEVERLVGALISPFYLIRLKFNKNELLCLHHS